MFCLGLLLALYGYLKLFHFTLFSQLVLFNLFSDVNSKNGTYSSKAVERKIMRKMRNGPGRNHCSGGRVEKSKGFLPNSFDRVLLDAPCSALGLRPRLFAGEVRHF